MNTDQLKSFIQVAENLNFARAAEILKITQSAVSRQIHSLEDELGIKASAPHYQNRYPYPCRDQLSGRRETCYGKTENCRAETAAPPKHKHADPNHRMPERGQSGPALQDTEILP